MHLLSQIWIEWSQLRMFLRTELNLSHLEFVREREREREMETCAYFSIVMWVAVIDKLSQALSELCSTVGVKAFSNTTGQLGVHCTQRNRTCFCQQSQAFRPTFVFNILRLSSCKLKPYLFCFYCLQGSIDRSLVGSHIWSAIFMWYLHMQDHCNWVPQTYIIIIITIYLS